MSDIMIFPETWEEFAEQYAFVDREQIYTNGANLIAVFRVEQWLEHLSETKITRCENCLWWDPFEPGHPYGYCHAAKHGYRSKSWEINIYRTTPADFFCKDGEPRGPEEEENDD